MIVLRLYLSALLNFPSVFKYLDLVTMQAQWRNEPMLKISLSQKPREAVMGQQSRIKGDKARGRI